MGISIRMHFDGKVFIPDEPVDVPINEPLDFELKGVPETLPWDPEKAEAAWQWIKSHPIKGLNIPDEALDRGSLYEDRGL